MPSPPATDTALPGGSVHGTEILIVGAGPTGLTLANLLGRMGVRTLIVERNPGTVTEPRAVSIDDESMRTMQALGLGEAVEAIVASGYGSRYLSPSGRRFAQVDPTSREYGFEKRNAFEQPVLEGLLRQGLERFDTVRALFGAELTGFSQGPGSVRAEIHFGADGTVRPVTVEARYMVACDGGRSAIRKQLGIPLEGSTFAERWLIVDIRATRNRFRHTEVFCDPRRSCISLPGPDGIRRYEFMLRAHEDEAAATAEPFVRGLLRSVGPDGEADLRRVRVYTFHARVAARWREGSVFLAGDAAHLSPPFAGQGMNSGLRDAHNLAWKLAEALRSASPETLLDSYERERKPHAQEMIDLALRMGRVMMPTSTLRGFFTRAGFRALSLVPRARDYVAQMRYKPRPRFRDGLLWPDGRPDRATMVGRLIPQPVVEDVQRRRHLLDSVLPDGPVILAFDAQPDLAFPPERVRALGIPVVGLVPEAMNAVAASFPIYRDQSRFFGAHPLAAYAGHAFLLRPDRYVAATAPLADVEALGALATAFSTPGARERLAMPVAAE